MDHESDSHNGCDSLSLSLDEYEHSRPRGRSNSEPSYLDYSLIHEVMSGTPVSKQENCIDSIRPVDEFPTSPIAEESNPPEYESLSSVMRQYHRDSVDRVESADDWSDANRVSFRFLRSHLINVPTSHVTVAKGSLY
jgi:hypothetical protein